jgi:RNase P/RNase MRP subunit POP5
MFGKDVKEMGLWLMRFNGQIGILKCKYHEKDRTIQLLRSIKIIGVHPVSVITVATSGTIRSLCPKQAEEK